MSPQVATAELLANRRLSHTLFGMRLGMPEEWGPAEPGQFVSLTLEPPWEEQRSGEAGDALLRRPFSIAGIGRQGGRPVVELLYAPVGKISGRMTRLEAGASVDLLGPCGTAFPHRTDAHAVLIAGGRGIAPMVYIAKEREVHRRPFSLLYGAREAREHLPLGSLAKRATLAAEDGRGGVRGTVIDLLNHQTLPESPVLMACGPHGMLDAVASWAKARGAECWVSVEEVFGCGIGICGGCAVPARGGAGVYERFLWACRDGPVVAADRIDWDAWRALDGP